MSWLEHQDLTRLSEVARTARAEHVPFTDGLHVATKTPSHHRGAVPR